MRPLDLLVPLLSVKDDEAALAAAELVAEALTARITALMIEVQPEPVYTFEGVGVAAGWSGIVANARKQFEIEKKRLEERLAARQRTVTTRAFSVIGGFIGRDVSAAARHADLTIMTRPSPDWQGDLRTAMFEGVLFGAGRPLLLAPPDWRGQAIGRNIVIAWNGKREAARALADARVFLDGAERITIVAVASDRSSHDALALSAADVAAHLTRRELNAEVRVIQDPGIGEAQALFAEAGALGADLVVMGGYGRSRLGEFIFGGVTREALQSARVPLLMSH